MTDEELIAKAKSWDRCWPGNLNIEMLVNDLTAALERPKIDIETMKMRLAKWKGCHTSDCVPECELNPTNKGSKWPRQRACQRYAAHLAGISLTEAKDDGKIDSN